MMSAVGTGKPSMNDPLGMRPDPQSMFSALEQVVDARIEFRMRGRALSDLSGFSDTQLVQELLARGWGVFHPDAEKKSLIR